MASDPSEYQKKGIKARNEAVQQLLENHQAEFDRILTERRLALGMSPKSGGPTKEVILRRRDKARVALAKWDKELERAERAEAESS